MKECLSNGIRWFALHGTNALIEFTGDAQLVDGIELPGKADSPDRAPELKRMLGSRFVAHPDCQLIKVKVSDPDHPIVAGIDDFEVEDEPCYCEYFGENHVLLEASYTQPSNGYVRSDFGVDQQSHPQMYLHNYDQGEVLHLTLGYCHAKYDLQPLMDICPVERGAWDFQVF